jgi:4-methyl-5(b-hydroxyethyl)-thiazole monophosphate biosynthesis
LRCATEVSVKIVVPLAEGFEEVEAVTIIDLLRRGGIDVTTASIGKNPVTGSHGITLVADTDFTTLNPADFEGIVLPGGMPGTKHLRESRDVIDFIRAVYSRNGFTAALCAAPTVLHRAGILKGKNVTVFPAEAASITDAVVMDAPVVVDGHVITGKAAGAAIDFSLALIREFINADTADRIRSSLYVYWNE